MNRWSAALGVSIALAGCGGQAPATDARGEKVAEAKPAEAKPAEAKVAEAPAAKDDAAAQTPAATGCAAPFPGATLAERLDRAQQACGGVLLVSRDDGLHALSPTLAPIEKIRDKPVRYVQVNREGEARELYYFAADEPDLVRLDLRTGAEEVLVTLPRLGHQCFTNAEPGEKAKPADPIGYVQTEDDVEVDVAAGTLCVTVSDRNANMASLMINFRADLRTRKVEQRTVHVGEDCRQGAGRVQPDACTPTKQSPTTVELPKLETHGLMSPSGRWAYYTDEKFEQSGDYIYRPGFVHDTQSGAVYAVTPRGLVAFDRAAADAGSKLPEDVCYVPGEASTRWMPGGDVLLLEGCGAAGWLLVEPPGRVQAVEGHRIVVYG